MQQPIITNDATRNATQPDVEFIGGVKADEAIKMRPNAFKAIAWENGAMVFASPIAAHIFKHRINKF